MLNSFSIVFHFSIQHSAFSITYCPPPLTMRRPCGAERGIPCDTAMVTPPTVKLPVRTWVPELAATRTVARPLPDPVGVSTVIHGVVVATVQPQPLPVAIVTETWPPL